MFLLLCVCLWIRVTQKLTNFYELFWTGGMMTSNNGLGFGGDPDGVHPVVRRFTCPKSIGIGLGLRLGLGLASNFK